MKFTSTNGDVFEGSVEEIFDLVCRMRPPLALPLAMGRTSEGKFQCPFCSYNAETPHGIETHKGWKHKKEIEAERKRIIEKAAQADKENAGL